MPRRTLARRFEPRYGVSQQMLEIEAKWLAKELEDYLLRSFADLNATTDERRSKLVMLEQTLNGRFLRLREPERLALQAMLLLDCIHMGMLYQTFLGGETAGLPTSIPPPTNGIAKVEGTDQPGPLLAFKQSLFD